MKGVSNIYGPAPTRTTQSSDDSRAPADAGRASPDRSRNNVASGRQVQAITARSGQALQAPLRRNPASTDAGRSGDSTENTNPRDPLRRPGNREAQAIPEEAAHELAMAIANREVVGSDRPGISGTQTASSSASNPAETEAASSSASNPAESSQSRRLDRFDAAAFLRDKKVQAWLRECENVGCESDSDSDSD